ncbi:MAG: ATP-binding cassette domain-containing protein [Thalassotalea sp.]
MNLDVSFYYQAHASKTKLAQAFTLDLKLTLPIADHIIGLFGESGAGKSTLLKQIAGLLQANNKQITYQNKNIALLAPEHSPCCYQHQQSVLFPHLTVRENLALVLAHGQFSHTLAFSLDEVVEWCELAPLLAKNVSALSGGEVQRIAFARSLLSGKTLILLDEPFSALDWQAREHMLRLLPILKSRYHINFIIVSHSLRELSLVASYLVVLKQGQLVEQGLSNRITTTLSTLQGQQATSALQGLVAEHLEQYQLTKVLLQGEQHQTIIVHRHHIVEDKVLLSLNANKVSIAKTKPAVSSIVNLLEVVVAKIERFPSHALISLALNEQYILAEISLMSLDSLALAVNERVYAQFKVL